MTGRPAPQPAGQEQQPAAGLQQIGQRILLSYTRIPTAEIWNEDTTGFPFSGQPKFDPRSDPALTFAPLVATWYMTDGAEGVEPTPEIKQIVDIINEATPVIGGFL